MAEITFTLNGRKRSVDTDADRPLLDVLREDFKLTGAKFGCGEGECGACSVLVNGQRAFSCSTGASEIAGKSITTIEGLTNDNALHPLQAAFLEEGAYQCGYCTTGMIIAAVALLHEKLRPTDAEIVEGMNGNLFRCCSYPKILSAVRRAAAAAEGRK